MLKFKCTNCGNNTLIFSETETLSFYQDLYLKDERTLLPFEEPFISESKLILVCDSCNRQEVVSDQDYAKKCTEHVNEVAWKAAKLSLGIPKNYEKYFSKYLNKEEVLNKISKEDLQKNNFLRIMLESVKKKRS